MISFKKKPSKEALKKHDLREKNNGGKRSEKIQKKKSSLSKSELTDKSSGLAASVPKLGPEIKKLSQSIPSHLRKYVWERERVNALMFITKQNAAALPNTCCK